MIRRGLGLLLDARSAGASGCCAPPSFSTCFCEPSDVDRAGPAARRGAGHRMCEQPARTDLPRPHEYSRQRGGSREHVVPFAARLVRRGTAFAVLSARRPGDPTRAHDRNAYQLAGRAPARVRGGRRRAGPGVRLPGDQPRTCRPGVADSHGNRRCVHTRSSRRIGRPGFHRTAGVRSSDLLNLAIFYPRSFTPSYSVAVLGCLVVLFAFNRARVYATWPYVAAGVALWLSLHFLGVHAALAGVLLAMFLPTRPAPRATPVARPSSGRAGCVGARRERGASRRPRRVAA